MKKFWSLFFIFWPIVAVVFFAVSPSMNWWFPGEAASTIGARIDSLFYLILYLTGAAFIGTQVAMGYALWRASGVKTEDKAWYSHGNHKLELIWTVIPALVLLFIAFEQMDVWAEFRMVDRVAVEIQQNPVAEVTARQFEWRMRYPAPGEQLQLLPQPSDMFIVNELVLPAGRKVVINLRTSDVQHSFFSPQLRVKQDAVPGKMIPIWFEVPKPGTYDLVCAELCGWGHYKMRALIKVLPEEEYDAFLQSLYEDETSDGFVAKAGESTADEE
ncbi:Alternative cytochrome c oxidase subunit 2 [Polystyrenella longa]|uniref:Cytochrome c oxidase subunit 2 n=1 Tax=Polystyrenella longa TaxID=2528007 RepID=A0A518CHK3_9PLAN|nr:cytochrome c oxidase subunit II [Polystyrenella longa]QDU78700.1 Alternative cytochrome c oxidase subunit 2 [Polystyrenella longa]